MPITNKAHIWTCSNNMNLHSFKEPIPTVYVLILNKCKCERNYLVVAIYIDCGEYLTFIPSSQKCAINADHRKTTHHPRSRVACMYFCQSSVLCIIINSHKSLSTSQLVRDWTVITCATDQHGTLSIALDVHLKAERYTPFGPYKIL